MRRSSLRRPAPGRAEHGFSVIELLVALLIAVEILIAMAVAFDVHNKVSRVQLQVTDMQQALRIAQWDITRMTRMAGRGGLKADLDPAAVFSVSGTPPAIQGRAIEVRNNVTGDDRYIARTSTPGGPAAFEGSDILTVRGCFSTPVYQLNPGFDADPDDDGDAENSIDITITRDTASLIAQPLRSLREEIAAYAAGATTKGYLLIGSWVSTADWGIAEIRSSTHTGSDDDPDSITLTLDLDNPSSLNPLVSGVRTFPTTIAASSACFLEEYRYYVRDVQEAADPITPLRPRLTRARFEPGTETAYQGVASNLTLDLADQVFDLQIALGLDTDFFLGNGAGSPGSFEADIDNIGDDDAIYEGTLDSSETASDDWLYNDPNDNPADAKYVVHAYSTLVGDPVDVYFVRVTTAARTARPDNTYQAPDLDTRVSGDWLEDHDFDDAAEPASVFNDETNRKHRRRTLTTIVEMRNI